MYASQAETHTNTTHTYNVQQAHDKDSSTGHTGAHHKYQDSKDKSTSRNETNAQNVQETSQNLPESEESEEEDEDDVCAMWGKPQSAGMFHMYTYLCLYVYYTATCKTNAHRSDGVPVVNWYKKPLKTVKNFPCPLIVLVTFVCLMCTEPKYVCLCVSMYVYVYAMS